MVSTKNKKFLKRSVLRRSLVGGAALGSLIIGMAGFHSGVYAQDVNLKQVEQDVEGVASEETVGIESPVQSLDIPDLRYGDDSGFYGQLENNDTVIYVREFAVRSAFDLPDKIGSILEAELTSRADDEYALKDVVSFVKQLEKKLIDEGYPLIRLYLVPQSIEKEGAVITLEVGITPFSSINIVCQQGCTDGAEEQRIVSELEKRIAEVVGGQYWNADDLSRMVARLNKSFGLTTRFFVEKGEDNSGMNLNVLVAFNKRSQSLSYSKVLPAYYDNRIITYNQVYNYLGGDKFNQFSFNASTSQKRSSNTRYQQFSLSNKTIFANADIFEAGISDSNSVYMTTNQYKLQSKSQGVYVQYSRPLMLKRQEEWYISAKFDRNSSISTNQNTGLVQNKDVLSGVTFGTTYDTNRGAGRRTSTDFSVYRGTSFFGARYSNKPGRPVVSRQHVSKNTLIYNLSHTIVAPINESYSQQANLSLQHTGGKPVLSSKMFSLTGMGSVRGLVNNPVSGDEGYVVSYQINLPRQQTEMATVQPYVRAAYGKGKVSRPTATEQKTVSARSRSLGVDVAFRGGYSLSLSQSSGSSSAGNKHTDENRTNFSLRADF